MARKTRRLAPRDAFIGVRDEAVPPPDDAQPSGEPLAQDQAREPAAVADQPQPQVVAAQAADPKAQPSPPSPDAASTAAPETRAEEQRLRELAQALQASSRGYAEKLTIYLPADVSAALADLWEKTRRETGVKIGKATLAQAALAIVLDDPALRIATVERALKAKLGA